MCDVVYFVASYGLANIYGYAYVDDLENDMELEPLVFTNEEGFTIPKLKIYADLKFGASEGEKLEAEGDCIKLEEAFTQDFLLPQILYDFRDEKNKIIYRDGYDLLINER